MLLTAKMIEGDANQGNLNYDPGFFSTVHQLN